MAYTSTDLTNLQAAIASGELRVQVGDQEVTYRSIWELRAAERDVSAALSAQNTGRLTPRWRQGIFSD